MPINEIPENKPSNPNDLTEVAENSPGNPVDLSEAAAVTPGNPSNLAEETASIPDAPIDLSELSGNSPGNPVDLSETAPVTPGNPSNLSEESASAPDAPNTLTATSENSPGNPVDLSEVTPVTPGNPTNLTETALASPGNPNSLTAIAAAVVPRTLTPVIDLNFAANTYEYLGEGDDLLDIVTYSRASSATYVERYRNALGAYDYYLKEDFVGTVTNLIQYSEQFDNADWTKSNSSVVADKINGPNSFGKVADKLVESGASASFSLTQAVTVTSGATVTFSVFAKADERNWVALFESESVSGRYFDLKTGSLGEDLSGVPDESSIRYVGDGWYYCSITATVPSTTATCQIYLAADNDDFVYDGDGASGLFIVGAQLTESAKVQPYVKTLGSSVAQAFTATPRLEWDAATGEALGYLSESSTTNLYLRSDEFDSATWSKTSMTVTTGADIAPDLSKSGIKLAASTTATIVPILFDDISTTPSAVHTASIYVKAAENSWVQIAYRGGDVAGDPRANFNVQNGTLGTVDPEMTVAISGPINGYYRISATATFVNATTRVQYALIKDGLDARSETNSWTVGEGMYFWRAQLEQQPFPTSSIRTESSTASRSSDIMSSSTPNLTAGTLFTEINYLGSSSGEPSNRLALALNDNTSSNLQYIYNPNGNSAGYFVRDSGVTSTLLQTGAPVTDGSFLKVAATFSINDFNFYVDAEFIGSDSTGTLPGISDIDIGNDRGLSPLGGHIKGVSIYGQVLTASEIQKL